MSSAQKIIQAAAGNAAGEALYVENVFSTYLYTGNGSTQTITNGIDLDGEGGLVWIKKRLANDNHALFDTERGVNKDLESNDTDASNQLNNSLTAFNSDGFSLGDSTEVNNGDGGIYSSFVSWTFRKAPKFFDVVTYTGDGTSDGSRTVSHNLSSVPGTIIVKRTDNTSDWGVYHRSYGNTGGLKLNLTGGGSTEDWWNQTTPTDAVFTLGGGFNDNGATYVAYLFAHNDGDGGFGEDADQDIIKCGGYTGGAGGVTSVDLGFEPQWVLRKRTSGTDDWLLLDVMRGFASSDGDPALFPNASGAESVPGFSRGKPTATGFVDESGSTGASYIYIAIRRGPMKTPESGTEVYNAIARTGTGADATVTGVGFAPDLVIPKNRANGRAWLWFDKLRGPLMALQSAATDVESSIASSVTSIDMDGCSLGTQVNVNENTITNVISFFRRAPGFFDVVAYEGDGTSNSAKPHNLGVSPELVIIKTRNATDNWRVTTSSIFPDGLRLQINGALQTGVSAFSGASAPDATNFYVSTDGEVNSASRTYIAYLFATLPGVSKVGSYTGTDADTTIDCGFSNGARFILIKRTDASGDWYVLDSERGLTTGSDPWLELNTTDAESTGNMINVRASGFGVSSGAGTNGNSTINILNAEYIFLAIA